MAKSSNKSKDTAASGASAATPNNQDPGGVSPAVSENNNAGKSAKATAKPSRKRAVRPSRKAAAAAKPLQSTRQKKAASAKAAISDDEIRLRAYFIAEQRAQSDRPGDSASDWLEARRQLLEEAAGRA